MFLYKSGNAKFDNTKIKCHFMKLKCEIGIFFSKKNIPISRKNLWEGGLAITFV